MVIIEVDTLAGVTTTVTRLARPAVVRIDANDDIPNIPQLRRALLRWYDKYHRVLPWRVARGSRPDPYYTLVSEAMLQQTQVATVVDYFQRFMAQFPTLRSLAQADEQQVLRLWQGLGYYRRARNLHAAAKRIANQHGGQVPDDVEQLMTLPGVGRYTAGAIASIAFGRQAAILDGNVTRVLARWYAINKPIDDPIVVKKLWSLAQELVPSGRPGDFNQAMMELGATVCLPLPKSPRCDACPVAGQCRAFTQGSVDSLPVKVSRPTQQRVTHHVVAIERRGSYLFQQRPNTGLWSKMWQMPTVEAPTRPMGPARLRQWVEDQFNLKTPPPCPPHLPSSPPHRVGQFTHATTHRIIQFVLWHTQIQSGRLPRGTGQWRRLDRLDDLPLPNPQGRVVQMLRQSAVRRIAKSNGRK